MVDMTVGEFLDRLASREPTPGGGSVAALVGALAAALASMVCELTIGKPKYAAYEHDLKCLKSKVDHLRSELTDLMVADSAAYENLSAAYKLPKDDAEAREEAIQDALVDATEVPMRIMEVMAQVLDLTPSLTQKGSALLVSDAGIAALLASAGLRAAGLNVLINLKATRDSERVAEMKARMDAAAGSRVQLAVSIHNEVLRRLQ